MRIVLLTFILLTSLTASDAKLKYEKIVSLIQTNYFEVLSKEELVRKSIDNLLKNTSHLTESQKQKIKKRVEATSSSKNKLKELLATFEDKGFLESEVYEMLISSCMDSLDVYSRYLDKEQMQELKVKTEGVFVGLGISLSKLANSLVVVDVLKNSPASKAGIKVSDVVLKINDETCDEVSLDKAIKLLRGNVAEMVTLSIKRDEVLMNLRLTRESIKIDTLEFKKLKNRTLYFKISSFDANIAQKISNKIKEHQESSKAIVLDLRGNPGGFVSQAVEVADIFLNRGNIITQVGRNKSEKKTYDASKQMTLTNLPLAVLIDSNTASSAEILSGALQIHHRATLFGERTFGKGSVESLYAINKDEALSLTVAHYFLADSSSIEGVGVLPDYEVNTLVTKTRDVALETAKEFLYSRETFSKKYPTQVNGVCTKEEK